MRSTLPTRFASSPTGSSLVDPRRPFARRGLARIDPGLEAAHEQRHRAQQTHGAGAQHDSVQATRLRLAGIDPRHTRQHRVELDEALLGDGERLGQHGDVSQ
jgi:hypothetical protein